MRKRLKRTTQPEKQTSVGKHGGNRGGHRTRSSDEPKRNSQAAGKDPQRAGKERSLRQ